MKTRHPSLLREFEALMREYLAKPSELILERAYNAGRTALDEGLGVVDVAALYHRALARVLRSKSKEATANGAEVVRSLEGVFIESLSPYEMTHRGYREAHTTLSRLNELLEDEAKKIAHALHDESGQLLVAVHLAFEDLVRHITPSEIERVEKVRAALDEMGNQLRRLARELRPPILDDLGLLPALQFLTEGFSKRTGIATMLNGLTEDRLPPRVEIALYRMVQEALTNVSKHSGASQVLICFERCPNARLACSIRDNGKGFDTSSVMNAGIKRGLGLPGIHERAKALDATLQINSSPGQGTELIIDVPVEA